MMKAASIALALSAAFLAGCSSTTATGASKSPGSLVGYTDLAPPAEPETPAQAPLPNTRTPDQMIDPEIQKEVTRKAREDAEELGRQIKEMDDWAKRGHNPPDPVSPPNPPAPGIDRPL